MYLFLFLISEDTTIEASFKYFRALDRKSKRIYLFLILHSTSESIDLYKVHRFILVNILKLKQKMEGDKVIIVKWKMDGNYQAS